MTPDCRPDPSRPRTEPVDRAREDCAHPAEYRQPGGLCGCCGADGFGANAWTEQDSVDLTIALVADDGHRMPLVGPERRAAVERMVATGVDHDTMAARLYITPTQLTRWAYRVGFQLPKPEPAWTALIAHPSRRTEYRRQYETNYAGRAAA